MTFVEDARRGAGVLVWLAWVVAQVVIGFVVQLALTPVAVIGVVAGLLGYDPADDAHCWMQGKSHNTRSAGYARGSICEDCEKYIV